MFLEACREELTLTPGFIGSHPVFVFDVGGIIAGFYALSGSPPVGELRDLFVDPPFIGEGIGGSLWDHAIDVARFEGFESLLIDADPNAVSFYASRGAVVVGESPSGSIPNRMLPQMRVAVRYRSSG
jgi:GNAT superfamily N-acetyltransferase